MGTTTTVQVTYTSGGGEATLADIRDFVEQTKHLNPSTRVNISGGSSQMDGPWWKFSVTGDASALR